MPQIFQNNKKGIISESICSKRHNVSYFCNNFWTTWATRKRDIYFQKTQDEQNSNLYWTVLNFPLKNGIGQNWKDFHPWILNYTAQLSQILNHKTQLSQILVLKIFVIILLLWMTTAYCVGWGQNFLNIYWKNGQILP